MAVDPTRLQRHLEDHTETTGRSTDRFVCPITLRECDESELIEGHILNEKLLAASRRTVIQYRLVDNFYGTRVEPDMVQFLNRIKSDGTRLSHDDRPTRVIFSDGSAVAAFPTNAKAAHRASPRFTALRVPKDGGSVWVLAEADRDDLRWNAKWQLEIQQRYVPAHWTAAMLKAGYLCLFDMIGYRSVYSPFGDSLRRTLASYYSECGTRQDANLYFREFGNSVKILTTQSVADDGVRWNAWQFDTLSDHEVLMHHSLAGTVFAVSCLFTVNGVTTSVMMPEGLNQCDGSVVWNLYTRFMEKPVGFQQRIHRARLEDGCWKVEEKPIDARFVDALPNERSLPSYEG